MLFDLPDEILTQSDLRKVASVMKSQNIEIGIMGYVIKNGAPHEKKIGIARANSAGDDILIESRHINEAYINFGTVYPQIVAGLKAQLRITA